MYEVLLTIPLAFWIVLALATIVRVGYVLLFKQMFKLTFVAAPARALLYFGAWSVIFLILFQKEVSLLFSEVKLVGWLALIFCFFVLFPAVFSYLRGTIGSPGWLVALFPGQTMLSLEERYIVAKAGDVFSQQLVAGILVHQLAIAGVNYPAIVLIFVAIFALSHIYLFFTSGLMWGLHYSTIALAGGFAIPFLILYVSGGIIYALIFHMLFYVFSAVFFAKIPRPNTNVCRDIMCGEKKDIALP
ncbi:MAG: hypothetical protein ACJKSS_03315 [Patescibacteria group bacterium UBA2103]